jgi:hypothetical protein
MRKLVFRPCGNFKERYEQEIAIFGTDFGRVWLWVGLVLLLGVVPFISSAYVLYVINNIGIAAIAAMERGKLSAYSFKHRPGVAGPYYKLQYWQQGKNHTRYVPADQVADLQAALAGHARYQELTRQYADLVIAETRQNIAASKKTNLAGDPPGSGRGDPATDQRVRVPNSPRQCRRQFRDFGAYGRVQVGQQLGGLVAAKGCRAYRPGLPTPARRSS